MCSLGPVWLSFGWVLVVCGLGLFSLVGFGQAVSEVAMLSVEVNRRYFRCGVYRLRVIKGH